MKTPEQAIREWALDQITFDVGNGIIVVWTREQVGLLHTAIMTKGNNFTAVVDVLMDLLNMEMRGMPWDGEFVIKRVGIDRDKIRDLQRAAKAGTLRLTHIDLVRYGGLRAAIDAIPKGIPLVEPP